MPSEFPRSKLLKGALVAYQLPELLPTIVVCQHSAQSLKVAAQERSVGHPMGLVLSDEDRTPALRLRRNR